MGVFNDYIILTVLINVSPSGYFQNFGGLKLKGPVSPNFFLKT